MRPAAPVAALVNANKVVAAERRLIHSSIQRSFKADDYVVQELDIEVTGGLVVHSLRISLAGRRESARPTLVMLHGWGAGLAYYSRSIPFLLTRGLTLHLVDMPGFGASSRPPCSQPDESFFVEPLLAALESVHGDSDIHLLGHSLGAYIASSLVLSDRADTPGPHIVSLSLISPVGIPRRPPNIYPPQTVRRLVFWVVFFLWGLGLTPQMVMRAVPEHIGRLLVAWWMGSRVVCQTNEEREALLEYVYWISTRTGSGEHAYNSILEPGAWAREPMGDRLVEFYKRSKDAPRLSFVYGEDGRDWMERRHAEEVVREIGGGSVSTVKNSGHHVYWDAAAEFSTVVDHFCSTTEEECREGSVIK